MIDLGDKGGLIIEVFNQDDELVQRTVGDSDAELLAKHYKGTCSWSCPYCYELACKLEEV